MNRPNWRYWFSLGHWLFYTFPVSANVNEVNFKDINDTLIDIYSPIIAQKFNSMIELNELYSNFGGAFKVDSVRKPIGEDRFIITLTGDIPRSQEMSMDGYAIVVCHELGHVLGGEPRQERAFDKWSSVEGQADYYATNTCMWNYVKLSSNVIHDFSAEALERCEAHFGQDTKKVLGCLRIMSGIQAMVSYFNLRTHPKNPVSISKQDAAQVHHTLQKYASPQCRVDTWVAGLFNQDRPRCWFKP